MTLEGSLLTETSRSKKRKAPRRSIALSLFMMVVANVLFPEPANPRIQMMPCFRTGSMTQSMMSCMIVDRVPGRHSSRRVASISTGSSFSNTCCVAAKVSVSITFQPSGSTRVRTFAMRVRRGGIIVVVVLVPGYIGKIVRPMDGDGCVVAKWCGGHSSERSWRSATAVLHLWCRTV